MRKIMSGGSCKSAAMTAKRLPTPACNPTRMAEKEPKLRLSRMSCDRKLHRGNAWRSSS